MTVLLLPPRLSLSSQVRVESRYGTKPAPFFLPEDRSARAEMTNLHGDQTPVTHAGAQTTTTTTTTTTKKKKLDQPKGGERLVDVATLL